MIQLKNCSFGVKQQSLNHSKIPKLVISAKMPEYSFTQKLPEKYSQTKRKEVNLECFVSDPRARVKWFKNGEPIEVCS